MNNIRGVTKMERPVHHSGSKAKRSANQNREMQMKLERLLVAALLVFGFAGIANAQYTQSQWLIVTSSESAPNAMPMSGCTKQNPDSPSSGSCYNPLILLFDLDTPYGFSWTQQAAVLSPDGSNVLSMTNSNGSNDGGATSTVKESSGV